MSDEAEVTRLVIFLNLDSIEFQFRSVPAVKRDEMLEESATVGPPKNRDASASVIVVAGVIGVRTAVNASRDTPEKSATMRVIRDNSRVARVVFARFARCDLRAPRASRCRSAAQVTDVCSVGFGAAGALNDDSEDTARWSVMETDDGKFAEPVTNARRFIDLWETIEDAGCHVSPTRTK